MRRPGLRGISWNALTLLLAVLAAGLAERRSLEAQADAAVVLAVTLEAPVLEPVVRTATGAPSERDTAVAGTPALVVRPQGEGPWPALVFVNGATRYGRHHPTVRRLAEGLARAGFLTVVPDPPGLARGQITTRTLDAVSAVARATAGGADARGGKVGFVGVSVGASLALRAAAEPGLAGAVTVVAGLAPYADLRETVMLATTGHHRADGRTPAYGAEPFLRLVAARSLAAALPPGPDRRRLVERTLEIAWESDAPLADLRRDPPVDLGPDGAAVLELLLNRDPRRFERLYARLPPAVRADVRRLSPLVPARRVRARVELASAPMDRYFPLDESEALVRAVPDGRLTVTAILRHAVPEASPRGLAGVVRLDAFAARVLRAAGASA